jgi:hypothetical protein
MEDYQAAFLERHKDTEILKASARKVAAMHLGGVTTECLLKAMIFASLPKNADREWKTDSNNPKHTISNPGHSFQDALKRHNRLNSRVDKFPSVKAWISIVENPSQHFIDMRYKCDDPKDQEYQKWLLAYESLIRWLQKQSSQL